MKIAFIARYFPDDMKGGGETHIYELWKRTKQDFDVSLISGYKNDPNLLPKETYPVPMKTNKFINYIRFYLKTKKFLKQIKPDLIFTTCPEIYHYTKSIFLLPHFGHWLHIKDLSLLDRILKYFYVKKINKFDLILTASESTKKDLESQGIKVHDVSYPGLDKNLKPITKKSKDFIITCPSRFSKEKGQHMLLRALMEVDPDIIKNIKVKLVGFVNDEKFLDYLKKASYGYPVEIITNVESLVPYYQNSDIVIFPTLMYEGFGIVAAEAAACSKPVIASDFPSIREILMDYGLYAHPGDTGTIAKHIETLYSNKKLRQELGKKSYELVTNKFSWDKSYKKLKTIFEGLK